MMKIDDLLRLDSGLRKYAKLPGKDPLTEDHALQEAQVLDVRFDVLGGVAGILFELRQALQLQEANTGVLVARNVRELTWSGPERTAALKALSVGSSMSTAKDRLFGLSLVMWPDPGARLTLTAESSAFFIGDVPGLPAAPPDHTEHDRATVATELAGWDSPFKPVSAVFLDPAPRA